jgi:ribosome-binding ATPase
MKIGILGLPQAGKTTLFDLLLTSGGIPKSSEARTESHMGIIKVPDSRLDELAAMFQPPKVVPATIQYEDTPPLGKGVGKEGRELLGQLRQTEALLGVIRCFEDPRIPHVEGSLDPRRDAHFIRDEFVLADLEVIEKRLERIDLDHKRGKKEEKEREFPTLKLCQDQLAAGNPLRDLEMPEESWSLLRGYQFLTAKPLIVLLNLGEDQWARREEFRKEYGDLARGKRMALVEACAKLELEICQLGPEEQSEFMQECGIPELGHSRLIRTSYELLGLISFFTYMGEEVRAWTLPRGSSVLRAAGTVHTDLERGFTRAEGIHFSELISCGSLAAARKKGLLRLEGKDYLVQDGDVIAVRFHV